MADTVHAIDTARDVVLQNICNAETTAFKGSHVVFSDGRIACTQLNFDQGALESTNRQLDLAIQGSGFFKIRLPSSVGDGFGYTRAGNFFINSRGELVLGLGDGYSLQPPITVPSGVTDIQISQDGIVSIIRAGSGTKAVIGQLKLTHFVNAEGLNVFASNIFIETDASGRRN